MTHEFRVRIAYSEWVRGENRDYTFDKQVEAETFDDACRTALEDFRFLEANSNVGWGRRIRGVEVLPGALGPGRGLDPRASVKQPSGTARAAARGKPADSIMD